jgi:hypothetical protein
LNEVEKEIFKNMKLYSMAEHKQNLNVLKIQLKCFKSEIALNSTHEKARSDLDEALNVHNEAKRASLTLVLMRDNLQSSLQKIFNLYES